LGISYTFDASLREVIRYNCTNRRNAFLSNDIPAVMQGRKCASPELLGDSTPGLGVFIAVYQ
jgi:hypothetical protein